jgi:hypothetical protein
VNATELRVQVKALLHRAMAKQWLQSLQAAQIDAETLRCLMQLI